LSKSCQRKRGKRIPGDPQRKKTLNQTMCWKRRSAPGGKKAVTQERVNRDSAKRTASGMLEGNKKKKVRRRACRATGKRLKNHRKKVKKLYWKKKGFAIVGGGVQNVGTGKPMTPSKKDERNDREKKKTAERSIRVQLLDKNRPGKQHSGQKEKTKQGNN